jgi:hypothetical protein
MITGCTQLTAVNYNSTSQIWDHTCMYIFKIWDDQDLVYKCIWFRDVPQTELEDRSFTLSYSIEAKNWVFFHDYMPDFYFHTREKLYNLKNQQVYRNNEKEVYGQYHHTPEEGGGDSYIQHPFFIDVIFRSDTEFLLETINWITSVVEKDKDNHNQDLEWNTLSHITIWNSQQHTGKIALKDIFSSLQYETSRKTNGGWSMNDFRNILKDRGIQFLTDLFNDYKLDPSTADAKAWYDKELIQDKYICVRFEYDNIQQKQVILHDTTIQAIKTIR